MKKKVWAYPLEDALDGVFDALDWIYWAVSEQNPERFVWIDRNFEVHEVMQFFGAILLSNCQEPMSSNG